MADIELVIKIDEVTYKDIKNGKVYSSVRDVPQESVLAIANGTPLPKGHGRLIDAMSYGGKKVGDYVVSDRGIERVIKVGDMGSYTSELVMSKEIFIEAYEKYIKEM